MSSVADQANDTMRILKKEKKLRAKETAEMSAIARADLLYGVFRNWDSGRVAEVIGTNGLGSRGMVKLKHETGRITWKARRYFDYDFYKV